MRGDITTDKPVIIYPNMAQVFSDCPMKFYWKYSEQVSYPILDRNFATGKNIHALAAFYLKNENIAKYETALTKRETEFWEYLKANEYFNLSTVGVEKNILKRFDKYWLGGRLDAIVKSKNNIYILDYKTGGVKPDMVYDYQTMIYCLLCYGMLKENQSLSFIYIDLKNKQNVKIDFNNTLKTEYETRLLNICTEISNFNPKKFRMPDNCNCEYKKLCE